MKVVSLSLQVPSSAQPPRVFALEDIKSWNRGDEPDMSSDVERPVIRITIRRDGIQNIERFQTWPGTLLQPTPGSESYIVDGVTELSGAKAYINLRDAAVLSTTIMFNIAQDTKKLLFVSRQTNLQQKARTLKSGDVIMGPQYLLRTRHERYLAQRDPAVLVVNEPAGDLPVVLEAYNSDCWSTPAAEESQPFEFPQHIQRHLGFMTYFSSAPLAGISCEHVFEYDKNRLCNGILFEYDSGGSQAVGQCRIGVELGVQYVQPSSICLRNIAWNNDVGRRLDGTQAAFGGCSALCHPPELWECRSLAGARTLQFWFSEERSVLSII